MDRIHVRDLHLRAIIGVHDWERRALQDVIVNLEIGADFTRAAASDGIDDALDYRTVTKRVVEHVEGSGFHLLEALAASIADGVLAESDAVREVRVTVDKPGALRFARSVAVEVLRRRP